jgi:hypothetical protein
MSLQGFTLPIMDGIRVKHGAEARITVTAGKKVLEDRLTSVESVGGALTVAAITYNRLSYSGGVSWWNPATGEALSSSPKVNVRVRPEDVLTGEQLCDCPICV